MARIGLDFRFLSAGTNTVFRGTGRYSQLQLREVLKLDSLNEYLLFCRPGSDEGVLLPEIRRASNLQVVTIRASHPSDGLSNSPGEAANVPEHLLRWTEEFQSQISANHIDLFHSVAPCVWHDLVLPRFDVSPYVCNYYDAIPMVFPRKYIERQDSVGDWYAQAMLLLSKASRLVAISKSAQADAEKYLGFDPERIDVAYPIADPAFRVMSSDEIAHSIQALRNRVFLPDTYILAVTHLHHSKNFETLLKAYSKYALKQRRAPMLVLASEYSEHERKYIGELADAYGIAERILHTGLVSDTELVALYNQAACLVHPSRYEGFGLPVLEAMMCGLPVITTTASSLPEVGGNAAVLVNPDDFGELAESMAVVVESEQLRSEMRQKGLAQAAKFTGEQLGQQTLACYRAALARPEPTEIEDRPTIALWTPLPPQKSGVADYSAELLGVITKYFCVSVFVDDGYLPDWVLLQNYDVQYYGAFERRQTSLRYRNVVYQLGASFFHLYMADALMRHPGLVLVHDLTWSQLLYHYHVGRNQLDRFEAEVDRLEGFGARRQIEAINDAPTEAHDVRLEEFLNSHYMLKDIVLNSRVVATTMTWSADELRKYYPGARVEYIPMGVDDPSQGITPADGDCVRAEFGVDPDSLLIGVFGSIDPVKRLEIVLDALAALAAQGIDARLLVVGEALDHRYRDRLLARAGQLKIADKLYFTGHVAVWRGQRDRLYNRLMAGCDVVVNLRYPSRKQMSGALMRAIAAGKPVIVSDIPEWRHFPEEFCWRLAPGPGEAAELTRMLSRLAEDVSLRETMGRAARSYFEENASLSLMADKYRDLIGSLTDRASSPMKAARKDRGTMGWNKLCEIEDFEDPALAGAIRDVFRHELHNFGPAFPRGAEYRYYWEAGQTVLALRELGALTADAVVLCLGAAKTPLPYYLSRYAGRVFAADSYTAIQADGPDRPGSILIDPARAAPYDFDRQRLVVQHMDPRLLNHPDDSFDAVVSHKVVDKIGGLTAAANAAYEAGRVLKPGGLLCLTTEFLIAGPPGGIGWDANNVLFQAPSIQKQLIEASGLELVGELDLKLSEATLTSARDLAVYIRASEAGQSHYPHIVLLHEGYVFCSLHLTLRKTGIYPASDNRWARPADAVRRAIDTAGRRFAVVRTAPTTNSESAEFRAGPGPENFALLRALYRNWNSLRQRGWDNAWLRRLPRAVGFLGRLIDRVVLLGRIFEEQSQFFAALIDTQSAINDGLAEVRQRLKSAADMQNATTTQLQTLEEISSQSSAAHQAAADATAALERVEGDIARRQQAEWQTAKESLALMEARAGQIDAEQSRLRERLGEIEAMQAQRDAQTAAAVDAATSLRAELTARGAELKSLVAEVSNDRRTWLDEAGRLEAAATVDRQAAQRLDQQLRDMEREVRELKQAVEAARTEAGAARQADTVTAADHAGRLRELTGRYEEMVSQLRYNLSVLRHLQARLEGSSDMSGSPSDQPERAHLVLALRQIELAAPELGRTEAVEVSIDGSHRESDLQDMAAYFGDRTSSRASMYRAPNDAWFHFAFGDDWARDILFESASKRLSPTGYFALVTMEGRPEPAVAAAHGLKLHKAVRLPIGDDRMIAYIWRPAKADAD